MKRIIRINACTDCPSLDHTGSFTKGGAKSCCNHDKTCETKGYDCFKRIIPNINKIPNWCPLESQIKLVKG